MPTVQSIPVMSPVPQKGALQGSPVDWKETLTKPATCVPCSDAPKGANCPVLSIVYTGNWRYTGEAHDISVPCGCDKMSTEEIEGNELFRYIFDRFGGNPEIIRAVILMIKQEMCPATFPGDESNYSWRKFGCACGECPDCPRDGSYCQCECGIPHIPDGVKSSGFSQMPLIDRSYGLVRVVPAQVSSEEVSAFSTALTNFNSWRQNGCGCGNCEHCASDPKHPICTCTCGAPNCSAVWF